eukprot:CAMPEP_0119496176 /NCGR_PEP_ID=MMETSP1344-20130328/19585_1 /TAXON_ID=236787 /ORGANISM="Florenciella parvula, Strain CCMP2471" /LENGTH=67 /DNA_ID=CAMNT_0007531831 /DNA_START=1 /DNA_END=201 /DNA_ORIENTATION=+
MIWSKISDKVLQLLCQREPKTGLEAVPLPRVMPKTDATTMINPIVDHLLLSVVEHVDEMVAYAGKVH